MSKEIDPKAPVDSIRETSGETNGMRRVESMASKIESCEVSDATAEMTVYGKAVTAEHLAAVLDYVKRIGAVQNFSWRRA